MSLTMPMLPSFLPDGAGSDVLFGTAAAFLVIAAIVQVIRRKRLKENKPSTRSIASMLLGAVVGATLAFLAYQHLLETRSWGSMANLLGGVMLVVLCLLASVRALKGGRWIGRIALFGFLVVATCMSQAALAVSQAAYANSSGTQDSSWWLHLYDIAVTLAEGLMLIVVVLWVTAMVWAGIAKIRDTRKANAAATTAPTSPAAPAAPAAATATATTPTAAPTTSTTAGPTASTGPTRHRRRRATPGGTTTGTP